VAWISYLRWVVLWMVVRAVRARLSRPWVCTWCTVRPPRSGVSPSARTGQLVW